jgi:hypothetical protein
MALHSPSLRRFVSRALVDTTGVAEPDRAQLASAFDTLCRRLRDRLQPLFGTAAVGALFVRSVHVATGEYPWLGEIVLKGQDSCSVDGSPTLGALDVNTLHEGLATVLAHNIGLLSAFVGEDLVLPLVQQAWGGSGASASEGAQ